MKKKISQCDIRLNKAYHLIDSQEIHLLSLDIFDTFLWRKVPNPEDLFLLLGSRLKEERWLLDGITPEIFAYLRQKGEIKGREEKKNTQHSSELTLTEIYWHLEPLFIPLSLEEMLQGNRSGIYGSDFTQVVSLEVGLEKELLFWDEEILKLITYAQSKKIKVVFVSNTYFEEEDIFSFFPSELTQDNITLYLSSAYRCNKQEGLFRLMLKDQKLDGHQVLHIGDSLEQDLQPASELNIKTLHYLKCDPQFGDVFKIEWPENLTKRFSLLDKNEGDFGLTSLRGKIAYHADLLEIKKEDQFFWKYGAIVLGPILAGFAHWIFRRCEGMRAKKVFCLMREGQFYSQLIKKFAPYYPQYPLESDIFWVSRPFVTLAAISSANGRELTSLMRTLIEHFTIEDFCNYLGFSASSLPRWSQYRHVVLEDPLLRKNFLISLINDKKVRKKITSYAKRKRKAFLTYARALCDLNSSSEMTLVDIGWYGTIQRSLHHMFQLENIPLKLRGLYLGTATTSRESFLENIHSEGYLFNGGYPEYGNAHKKGCFVLEQMATAETGFGSLCDITDQGEIMTLPCSIPAKQKKEAELVQKGIFAFIDSIGPYIKNGAIDWSSNSEALQNQLRIIFLRSMIQPTQHEAIQFGTWYHEHGPSDHLTQVIGKNDYYDNFITDLFPTAALKENDLYWLSAYTAKKSKYLTLTSETLLLNKLPSRCFLSEDSSPLHIFIDSGKGYSQKAHKSLTLRSNANRNFYMATKIFSLKKEIQSLQLLFDAPQSLLRIKSIRMTCYNKEKPDPTHHIFFESPSSEIMEAFSGKSLECNAYYSQNHLILRYTFPLPTYQIKIKLSCEIFKLNTNP